MKPSLLLSACVATGTLCFTGCGNGNAADAPTTAQIIEHAPSFQVLLDISGSSPALDQQIMKSVTPKIVEKLKTMPAGTQVSVNTVGDATVTTSMLRMQIQARGTTASDVARKLQRLLLDFPAQASSKVQGRSDLVGGFAAAASYVNRRSDANQIFMVSDLVEYSAVADCRRALRCKLPVAPAFDLSHAQVHVYGVGQGLTSDRAMQLTEDWRVFLGRAKARAPELHRF